MSTSDFLKHLFLAAVGSGQIRADASAEDTTATMEQLMNHYLHAAQHMGRLGRRARRRVSPPHRGELGQDQDGAWVERRGGALPS